MRPLIAVALLVSIVAAAAPPAQAQTEAEMKRLDELDRVCEQARSKKLAPLRAERIERCVAETRGKGEADARRVREQCEREFANFGDTQQTRTGANAGMFYDLPECVAAFEARQRYRR
jgi:hypothetical protein